MHTIAAPAVTAPSLTEPCPTCRVESTFGDLRTNRIKGSASVRSGTPHWQYRSNLTCPEGHTHDRKIARWFDGDAAPVFYGQGELVHEKTTRRRASHIGVAPGREYCFSDECPRWATDSGLCRHHERALGL